MIPAAVSQVIPLLARSAWASLRVYSLIALPPELDSNQPLFLCSSKASLLDAVIARCYEGLSLYINSPPRKQAKRARNIDKYAEQHVKPLGAKELTSL